jgi:hypothetical protein
VVLVLLNLSEFKNHRFQFFKEKSELESCFRNIKELSVFMKELAKKKLAVKKMGF